jgi:hypothetical protein
MPRGVPAKGYRNRKNALQKMGVKSQFVPQVVVPEETDEEISARLDERFNILSVLTDAAINGDARSVIVSGAPGLGKSYTVEKALEKWDPNQVSHGISKGYIRTTGLYKLLYQYRRKNQVLVFDDCDNLFNDDNSLNLLKAVCDTTERRIVSYLAETNMVDEESAEKIPRHFVFEGTVIFITNLDFAALVDKGHKLAPHLEALMSRSHYIDLDMKTRRDYMVRIGQVIKDGMLKAQGLSATEEKDVVDFLNKHSDNLREVSLRVAIKVGALRKMGKPNWASIAKVTCCK